MTTAANVSLLARLRMTTQEWSQGANQARQDLTGIKETFDQNKVAAKAAAVAFTAALGAGILGARNAVNAYAEFEQAIRNVASVAGATSEEMRQLEDAALRIGASTRLTADQAADALYNLASAGFDTQQSIDALEGTTDLALATLSDLGTSSALITSTINQFGLEAAEASRVADTFANAIAASPANMERLTHAMRNAGPFASALGVSLEETTAAASALFRAGLEGGQAGASLRFFLSSLLNPTERAREAITSLGLSMDDVNPQIVGIAGALEALIDAGVDTSQAIDIFSTRGATAFLSLSNIGVDSLRELTDEVGTVGTASRIAEEQMDTFSGSVENLASSLAAVRISIGGFLARILRPFVDGLTSIVDTFGRLPAPIQAVIAAIGVLAGAVASAGVAFITFGGAIDGGLTRLRVLIGTLRTLPTTLRTALVALRAKTVAVGQATAAWVAYAAAQARAALARFNPAQIIASLRSITQSLIAATAAQLGFNRASVTGVTAFGRLGTAARGFFAVLNAHPIIRVITLALAALIAIIQGVRNNVGGLGDAWAELMAAFEPAREAIAGIAELLRRPLSEGMRAVFSIARVLAPLIGGVLTLAARGLASVLVQLAQTVRAVGNGMLFLKEIFTEGPLQAARNFAERSREAFEDYRASMESLRQPIGALAQGLDDVTESIEDGTDAAQEWRRELARVTSSFDGAALERELGDLLVKYGENEEAVQAIARALEELPGALDGEGMTDDLAQLLAGIEGATEGVDGLTDSLKDAKDATSELADEAARLSAQFGERLDRIRLSFIDDDETRKIEEARREFAKLREELHAAAAANEDFAASAHLMIAESYTLEAEQIRRIREDAHRDAVQAAQREREELERLAEQRENAITQLVIDGTEDRIERTRLEYLRRKQAVSDFYHEWEIRAGENAEELKRIADMRAQELGLIDQAYINDVLGMYEDAYDRLEERGRQQLRRSLEAAGDARALLSFDIEEQRREADAFYDDLEARAGQNAHLLAEIARARNEEQLDISQRFFDGIVALGEETTEALIASEERLARTRATVTGDTAEQERLDYEERVRRANEFYDQQEARADGNRIEMLLIAQRRNEELGLLDQQFQDNLARIHGDEFAQAFRANIDRAIEGLRDMDEQTLASVEEQLGLWRRTYGDNGAIVALVDAALSQVAQRNEELEQQTAESLERQAANAEAYVEQRARAETRVAELAATVSGDQIQQEQLRYDQRIAQADAFYQELETLADGNAEELLRVAELRDREMRLLLEQFQTRVREVESEISQGRLEQMVSDMVASVVAQLGDATDATLETLQAQLEAWRAAYAGNEGVVAIVDRALAQVTSRKQEAAREAEQLQAEERQRQENAARAAEDLAQRQIAAQRRTERLAANLTQDRLAQERLAYQERVREAEAHYREMEELADGNREELARVAQLRAEELRLLAQQHRDTISEIESEIDQSQLMETMTRATDQVVQGLDEADQATLRSMRAQLEAWRTTYAGNDGVVGLVDDALTKVEDRYTRLTEEVARRIDSLVEASDRFVTSVDTEVARKNMSQVERVYVDAADRIGEATKLIEDLQAELAEASGAQRAVIEGQVAELRRSIGVLESEAVREAREMTERAIEQFQEGLERARESASRAAVSAIQGEVRDALRSVVQVNEQSILTAREQLGRLIADLTAAGVSEDALATLRESADELDDMLARVAERQAQLISDEASRLRRISDAVLNETEARRVRLDTMRAEVDAHARGLASARERGASLDEMREATNRLITSQLQYLDALRSEADVLRQRQRDAAGAVGAVGALADVLGKPVDPRVLDVQRQLAENLFDQVRAAQEAGQSYHEYKDLLDQATAAQREYTAAAEDTIKNAFDALADKYSDAGRGLLDPDVQQDVAQLAQVIADTFGVSFDQARLALVEQLQQGAREADPEFDFVDDLERRLREAIGPGFELALEGPESAKEVFENLTEEALKAPEAIRDIQVEIDELEAKVEELAKQLQEGVDFGAFAEGALTAFGDVMEALERDVPDAFGALADAAIDEFDDVMQEELDRLLDTMRNTLSEEQVPWGEAGVGLINAFSAGIRQNREAILSQVRSVLAEVRSYLPSSDAKRGPLRDLTKSGRAFVNTFLEGVSSAAPRMTRMMNRMLSVPAARQGGALSATAAGGYGDIYINLPVGAERAPAGVALPARALADAAIREARILKRLEGGR